MSRAREAVAAFDRKAFLNRLNENINAWTPRAGVDLTGASMPREATYRDMEGCTHQPSRKHGTKHAFTVHECRCRACKRANFPPVSAFLK